MILHLDYTGSPADEAARDWTIWDLAVSSMAFTQRETGLREVWFGGNDTGATPGATSLLRLDDDVLNDYASASPRAIDAYYQTDYIGGVVGRRLFGYMTSELDGIGTLNVFAYPVAQPPRRLGTTFLDPAISHDKEWLLPNIVGERVSFRYGTARLNERWSLRKLAVFYKLHPWMKIRGMLS